MTKFEFAQAIAENIEGAEAATIIKNGQELNIVRIYAEGSNIAPMVYVDRFFDEGFSIARATEEVEAAASRNAVDPAGAEVVTSIVENYDVAKDYLQLRLVNKYAKPEVFKEAEEYGFSDLCLVPYISGLEIPGVPETGAVKVTKSLLDSWGITADEAIKVAAENSNRKQYDMVPLDKMIASMLVMGEVEAPDPDPIPSTPMYVLTNAEKYFGAYAVIAMKDNLDEKFPNGYIVLPSSIHEVIVVPAECYDAGMETMVREINATTVDPTEQLSDNVYIINGGNVNTNVA